MAKAKWMNYSVDEIKNFAKESRSNAEFLSKMGYSKTGGSSTQTIEKILIAIPDLDLSHFTGQGWRKNQYDMSKFKDNSWIKNGSALNTLKFLRGCQCEKCKLKEWNGEPIPLEVHHIDGNHYNNDLSNLQLLCPNCHALTNNWRGRNIKERNEVSEEEFVKALKETPNIRQALLSLNLTAAGANYERAHNLIEKYHIEH